MSAATPLEAVEADFQNALREFETEKAGLRPPRIVTLGAFLAQDLPPRELLLSPWLPRQGLVMVHAYRGIGKTFVALHVAYAVASGGNFLGWGAQRPAGVFFLDGEMPAPVLQERLAAIVAGSDREIVAPFNIMTPDLQPIDRPSFNLANIEDQESLNPFLKGIDLIIVDNLSTMARGGKANDAESWLPIQEWALKQRAAGRSVLFIHHSGKSGAQRGTSAKEDVLDTVIGLRRPSDYEPSQGARFEVHFEKARGFSGTDSDPIEASLIQDQQGRLTWVTKPLDDVIYDRVIELHADGLNHREIAEEVGRDRSRVTRMIQRAKKEGRIHVGIE